MNGKNTFSEKDVGKYLMNITLANYNKGLQAKLIDSGEVDTTNNQIITNTDNQPTIPKPKTYSVKKDIKNMVVSKSSSSAVQEFLKQSEILDNELSQFITTRGLGKMDMYFKKPNSVGGDIIQGGAITENDYSDLYTETENINRDLNAKILKLEKYKKDFILLTGYDSSQLNTIIDSFKNSQSMLKTNKSLFDKFSKMKPTQKTVDKLEPIQNELHTIHDGFIAITDNVNHIYEQVSNFRANPELFVKKFENYSGLSKDDQRTIDEIIKQIDAKKLEDILSVQGYTIERELDNSTKNRAFNLSKKEDLIERYKSGIKKLEGERKGLLIKPDATIDLSKGDAPQVLKKISNIITNLSFQADILVKNKMSGSTYETNRKIMDLYDEIGDKMYFVSKLNIQNDQIHKLDKNFDKLYKLIVYGIQQWQPSTTSGGSMVLPSHLSNTPRKYTTLYPHLL